MKKKYHDKELPLGLKERKGQFLVLGRAGLDLYPHPEGSKIFSAHMFRSDLGGSAGNICVSLIRNGFSASLIGAISNDPVGKFVKEKLKEYVPIIPVGNIVFGLKTISPDASSPVTEAPIPFQKLA